MQRARAGIVEILKICECSWPTNHLLGVNRIYPYMQPIIVEAERFLDGFSICLERKLQVGSVVFEMVLFVWLDPSLRCEPATFRLVGRDTLHLQQPRRRKPTLDGRGSRRAVADVLAAAPALTTAARPPTASKTLNPSGCF